MKCIFCCIFNNENYIKMFYLLLESIYIYGNLGDDIDILIYTSTQFMNIIKQSHLYTEKIKLTRESGLSDNVCTKSVGTLTPEEVELYSLFLCVPR